jgi:hypothetical protein
VTLALTEGSSSFGRVEVDAVSKLGEDGADPGVAIIVVLVPASELALAAFKPASPFVVTPRSTSVFVVPFTEPDGVLIVEFDSLEGVFVPDVFWLTCAVDTVVDAARPFAACAYENVVAPVPGSPSGLDAVEVIARYYSTFQLLM